MKQSVSRSLPLFILLGLILLGTACGPSQEELDATSTRQAADGFATQTAAAPTATLNPTDTPTATPEPTVTPTSTPPSAETFLEEAFTAIEEAESLHMQMEIAMSFGMPGMTFDMGILFDGDYQPPDRVAGTYRLDAFGESNEFEIITVDGNSYINEGESGEWVLVTDESGAMDMPVVGLTPGDYGELEFLAEETLAGENVYHFQGIVPNPSEIMNESLALSETSDLFDAVEPEGDMVVDFWVSTEDGLLRQTDLVGDLVLESAGSEGAAPEKISLHMAISVRYSNYNEPVTIEAPENVISNEIEPQSEITAEDVLASFSDDAATVYVAADGSGDYQDLRAAIGSVAAGTTIELAPGLYELDEALIVEESLALIGSGVDETVIVSRAPDWSLLFNGEGPFMVRDMAIRHEGGLSADVVTVIDGIFLISDCRLTGGVYQDNSDTGAGLKLLGNASGVVSNCISEENDNGFYLDEQVVATLVGNRCSDNLLDGISFYGASGGSARENVCADNGIDGISVWGSAQPIIEDNTLTGNVEAGLSYFEEAGGEASRNNCSENDLFGIYLDDMANPYLEANDCRGNGDSGLVFFGQSFGFALDNDCSENGLFGMAVAEQASPLLMDNRCNDNGDSGFAFFDQATGSVTNSECARNLVGIYIETNANPDLSGNNCHDNSDADIEDERESSTTATIGVGNRQSN